MSEHTLTLQARFDRTLVRLHDPSVRYLVVETTAPAPERSTEEMPPLNLGVVIDASGSMEAHDGAGGRGPDMSRLEAAQQASKGIAQCLDRGDTLSLVSFADEAMLHLPATRLDDEGKQAALRAIGDIETRGITNLYEGWMAGAEQVALHKEKHPEGIHRLLILTDGQANDGLVDPDELAEVAANLRLRGISTSTVGIGQGYSTEQIEPIAEHGGGMLHHTEFASDIIEVVLAELKDMRSTVIDDLGVAVHCLDDRSVKIEAVGAVMRGGRAGLGSLVANATRRAVFRVKVPAGRIEELRFEVKATWRGADGRAQTACSAALIPAHDEAVYTEAWDQAVCAEAARIWQAEIVRKALELNRAGDYAEARRFAKAQKRYFGHYASRLDEGEELLDKLEQALERMQRPMEEYARKEIGIAMHKVRTNSLDYRIVQAPPSWDKFLRD